MDTSRVDGVSHRLNEHTKKLDYYTGNYDSYVRERSIRDDEQQRKYDAEQRDIAEIKDFIARLVAASECTHNRKRNHPRHREMATSRINTGSATAPSRW